MSTSNFEKMNTFLAQKSSCTSPQKGNIVCANDSLFNSSFLSSLVFHDFFIFPFKDFVAFLGENPTIFAPNIICSG